jgi:hypothetical protein
MDNKKPTYVTEADANNALPKEVSEQFKIVNWGDNRTSTKFYDRKFGEINLRTMSLAKAKQLVKKKCSFLEAKNPSPKAGSPKGK